MTRSPKPRKPRKPLAIVRELAKWLRRVRCCAWSRSDSGNLIHEDGCPVLLTRELSRSLKQTKERR
jgi:hypothetical protein